MGCGSSANVPQDPEKFPSHLLFQFTDVVVKHVSLQRNDQLSKENLFQILLESFSAQMDVLSRYKSNFIRLSIDNRSLRLKRSLFSIDTPLQFWTDAEAGKSCSIKISMWSHQARSDKVSFVENNATANFVGDVCVFVGGAAESDGAAMFSLLTDTSKHRFKTQSMTPLILSTTEILQNVKTTALLLKDELNTHVVDINVRIGSCNQSGSQLEDLLDQHMMEALHQRRLAQQLLHICDYARHHAMAAPLCMPHDLTKITELLKASKKTVERSLIIQDWSAKVACSCFQIGQLLELMRYDEERAVGLAHLILRSSDGHEIPELLKLCSFFDTDAKLESAYHHVHSFYKAHCLDHGFPTHSSRVHYSPASAITRAGSDSEYASSESNTVTPSLSREPSSGSPSLSRQPSAAQQ